MADRWLSKPVAAKRMGIKPQTLQRMIDNKEIVATKINFRWKIREFVVEEYLATHSNIQPQKNDQTD